MPTTILAMYQQRAFVVSINGRPWHSVAIDESHEMQVLSDKKILCNQILIRNGRLTIKAYKVLGILKIIFFYQLDQNYKGNNFTFPYSEISALSTLAINKAQIHLFLK